MELDEQEAFDGPWYSHGPMRNALLAGLLAGAGFGLSHAGILPALIENALYAAAIPLGGYHWMREGVEKLRKKKKIGIEILMMAATIGSMILGMWDEAAALVVLYGAAEGLEEYTFARTRASIRKLLDLAPKEARVVRDGRETIIPAETLAMGDIFIVRPGESIPTDGVVARGRSSVNEAPVTGESMPVEKEEGARVFAATLNQNGALEVKVTATFKDNTLAKMVHLVEQAQEQKSKNQLFIERFGDRYSPLVLLTSVLLLIVPPLLGASFVEWAGRAVVLSVAAAPCALVMSTPVAIAAGIGRAGKSGVLIKGGIHLENLGKLKAIAFDKTGTLTKGQPLVTDLVPLRGDAMEVLRLAHSVEKASEHSLAQAIVAKSVESGMEAMETTDFAALVGLGARARVAGKVVYVAKPDMFESFGLKVMDLPEVLRLRAEGKTVVGVGTEKEVIGLIAMRDEERPGSKEAVAQLHQRGLKTVMLTGDHQGTARSIALRLGIDDIEADLKPDEKVSAIERLTARYGPVAMVGDGINDAPALAKAAVGIAMGVAGTDAAIEAADVALMSDDLAKVVYAVDLGRRARRIGRQNICFSLLILAVLIPLALSGVLNVAAAVIAHELSELLAVANGLRTARRSHEA